MRFRVAVGAVIEGTDYHVWGTINRAQHVADATAEWAGPWKLRPGRLHERIDGETITTHYRRWVRATTSGTYFGPCIPARGEP